MLQNLKIFSRNFNKNKFLKNLRKINKIFEKIKKLKEKFCKILRIFLKLIIILDTIEEIWDIFINFQIFLWESQRLWINIKKRTRILKAKNWRNYEK